MQVAEADGRQGSESEIEHGDASDFRVVWDLKVSQEVFFVFWLIIKLDGGQDVPHNSEQVTNAAHYNNQFKHLYYVSSDNDVADEVVVVHSIVCLLFITRLNDAFDVALDYIFQRLHDNCSVEEFDAANQACKFQ